MIPQVADGRRRPRCGADTRCVSSDSGEIEQYSVQQAA